MKIRSYLLSATLCLLFNNIQAQHVDFDRLDLIKINSLDSLAGIGPLKEVLEDKRIVLLGEQTHGEGSTFDAKVALIKFLHQELGFDIIAFESGLYSNYKAAEIDKHQRPQVSTYFESVGDVWSDSKQFENLINYIKKTKKTDNPLDIMGFDLLEGALFKEYYFDDLTKLFRDNNLQLADSTLIILKDTFFGDVDYVATNSQDSLNFYSAVQLIEEGFAHLPLTGNAKILHQSFLSYLAGVNWAVDNFKGKSYKVQNPRDLQMAKNLVFLTTLYPDKKIIGWGANYHFANQIQMYHNTTLSKQYISKMVEENETQDLDSSLYGAVPMGKILKEHFKEDLYSLAFSSFEGTYGLMGTEPDTILTPPDGSLEYYLAAEGYDHAFVNFLKDFEGNFYSSSLGNLPILAPWQIVFDGHFFIRFSYPPEFSKYADFNFNALKENEKSNFHITGRITDSKTGQPVPYAHISLFNASGGTVSNDDGIFRINFSPANINGKLVFSSVGYKKHEISLRDYADTLEVQLLPEMTLLNEIVVSDKSLSARQVVKKAKQSIESNYYQQAFNQELFYRVQKKEDDSITFNEEAAVLVYNEAGYKPSDRAYRNFYGQILQFRNTTENPEKYKWDGVGSLWLVFSHDLILDKDNILHRTSAYDLEITNVLPYEDKTVYEIKFQNKRPSAYTTGYGYPAPKASHGKLYIDTKTYAVLRYEHCIERKDSKIKKNSEYQIQNNRIQLIQIYNQLDNKYFLTLSKQTISGTRTKVDTNDSTPFYQRFDLLSTAIDTDNLKVIEKPLEKIKIGMKIEEDKEFWQQHNYFIEDNKNDLNICE
ncbi:MAG: carboxypeptidase-like regulatory domain-containing protein [Candidatus Cyclobacteriaceae bacterium M3_2C_046]